MYDLLKYSPTWLYFKTALTSKYKSQIDAAFKPIPCLEHLENVLLDPIFQKGSSNLDIISAIKDLGSDAGEDVSWLKGKGHIIQKIALEMFSKKIGGIKRTF